MKQDVKILSVPPKVKDRNIDIESGYVYSYPVHGHLYYEILVYDAFAGEITVNGEKFDTEIPTAILISPNDFHSITVREEKSVPYYKLLIQSNYMEGMLKHICPSVVMQNREQVSLLFRLCKEAYQNWNDLPYLASYTQTIVLTLQKSATKSLVCGKSTILIRQAIELISSHFSEPITLESTAKELHVSPQYLSNLFSRYAQMSFIEYLTERRLHYATILLQNGANVSEACFQSGYRNLSHFIRTFKRKYGVTPAKMSLKK